MGRQRIKTIEAEVGGSLTPEDLRHVTNAERRAAVDRPELWRNLFGAAASNTDPVAAAEREARRMEDAARIGNMAVAPAPVTWKPEQP